VTFYHDTISAAIAGITANPEKAHMHAHEIARQAVSIADEVAKLSGTLDLKRKPCRLQTYAEMKRDLVVGAIARNEGNLPRAARELGVSTKTMYNWADELAGYQPPPRKVFVRKALAVAGK
jgi:DNA-binding NtrC family response regulator